jgi:hypothetical protein
MCFIAQIMRLKINFFNPDPKGSKLIFSTPFRDWGKS